MVQRPAPGAMSPASLLVKLERVRLLIKAESVETVDNAGIKMYKSLYTVNTKMFEFKHPNYYKNLKKIRDSLGPEAEDQASSFKPQASSVKPQAASNCRSDKMKHKHQASSSKAQASSSKRT